MAGKIHPDTYEALASSDGRAAVWILFVDKGTEDLDEALARLQSAYNTRALQRRSLRRTAPGLVDVRDLPLNPTYVDQVLGTGADLRVASRWINGVSVVATHEQIETISRLQYVKGIQPVLPAGTPPPTDRRSEQNNRGGFYGFSEAQLSQIHLIDLHDAGFTGEGVIVGVLDTGFRRTHAAFNHADNPLEVVAEWDFVNNDPNTAPEGGDHPSQHQHGTMILGALAAYAPGLLVGGAFDASFILAKVEDFAVEQQWEEDLFVAGLEFIEANGGDIATSSVVIFDVYSQEQMDGMTSVMTIGFNTATENGIHCFQAAGNEGHDSNPETSHLVPPADAFLVNTIGAVTSTGEIAGFSSDGPTADGRVKPELLARGQNTYTVDPDNDMDILTGSGTSLATPLAATAGACLVQARPEWSVGQMREALNRTASDYASNGTFDSLFVRGYGIIDAYSASQHQPTSSTRDAFPHSSFPVSGYPNPWTSGPLTILYTLPEQSPVQVAVYDFLGRRVVMLQKSVLPAGRQTLEWDGLNDSGNPLGPGTYFVCVRAGGKLAAKRFVVLR